MHCSLLYTQLGYLGGGEGRGLGMLRCQTLSANIICPLYSSSDYPTHQCLAWISMMCNAVLYSLFPALHNVLNSDGPVEQTDAAERQFAALVSVTTDKRVQDHNVFFFLHSFTFRTKSARLICSALLYMNVDWMQFISIIWLFLQINP